MDIFHVLTLIGGLSLFLFGMNIMGQALEQRAGANLRSLLGKMTTNRFAGLLTGLSITAVIQSSSATTVMVVGFVNSGLLTLSQAINVIMGANIGTTITAWILSLAGIDSSNVFVQLLKPSSFVPILGLIGIVCYMFCKKSKTRDTGLIFLGFATLMFGMETMSGAVSVLKNVPEFTRMFILFQNPLLGVIVGAILTAIIQSSSASVGILQALAITGQVTTGAAIPIIMGQNIGTCITAIISSVGANKNAKRAAMVHLGFNVIGTTVCLVFFWIIKAVFNPRMLNESASLLSIAVIHSIFNVLCTLLMLPFAKLLEKMVCKIIPDSKETEKLVELDERLLATPPIALQRCEEVVREMAQCSFGAINTVIKLDADDIKEVDKEIRYKEDLCDRYEDMLGSYLVKFSTQKISSEDSNEAAKILRLIGDLERISDHAVGILEAENELKEKGLAFTPEAKEELLILRNAVCEITELTQKAFLTNDISVAYLVDPLNQVIKELKEELRADHIARMQHGKCSIEVGFIWSDFLTDFERVSGHCSNITGCIIDMNMGKLNLHESLREVKLTNEEYRKQYLNYRQKYSTGG